MNESTIIQAYTDAIYTHTQKNVVGAGPPHIRKNTSQQRPSIMYFWIYTIFDTLQFHKAMQQHL